MRMQGPSQSSLKRVLVSDIQVAQLSDRYIRLVAILFEASPGFRPYGHLRPLSICTTSQSSLKRVLVSDEGRKPMMDPRTASRNPL